MLIHKALASDVEAAAQTVVAAGGDVATTASADPWGAMASQFILITLMIGLFYVLLIMPQKKRFKEHKTMLDGLKKGDRVITAGGLLGQIEKIEDGSDEVILDMGHGTKVTALRSTIHQKHDASNKKDTKKDAKKDEKKDEKKKN